MGGVSMLSSVGAGRWGFESEELAGCGGDRSGVVGVSSRGGMKDWVGLGGMVGAKEVSARPMRAARPVGDFVGLVGLVELLRLNGLRGLVMGLLVGLELLRLNGLRGLLRGLLIELVELLRLNGLRGLLRGLLMGF